MSDFTKGVISFFLAIGAIVLLFSYLGRSWVYSDQYKNGLMLSCQSNGYTWGDCFNVIHGNKDAFDK